MRVELDCSFGCSLVTAEHPDYTTRQLITCLGNKRALLGPIGVALERVKRRLGRDRLRVLDAFAGYSKSFVASKSHWLHSLFAIRRAASEFGIAIAAMIGKIKTIIELVTMPAMAKPCPP